MNEKTTFPVDFRLICAILAVIILGMLALWKPWMGLADTRTVEITGEAKITSAPDEFTFYPSYSFQNSDRTAALADLSKKSSDITAALKGLGIADADIQTNSSGTDYPIYYQLPTSNEGTYTLQFTITTHDLATAQKTEDYLITTTPIGGVSPTSQFSDTKRKQLETQAREDATKDARSKADQLATNLGFKIQSVKSVTDGQGFGIVPMAGTAVSDGAAKSESLAVQPGQNDLNYSVTVTYYIR